MKIFISFIFLFFSLSVYAPAERALLIPEPEAIRPYEAIWSAICSIESSNNPLAIGDTNLQEHSYGIVMIRRERLDDYYNRTGIRYTVNDMFDPAKAKLVFMHYATGTDMEVISRTWNGGERGMEKESTVEYWTKKIKPNLNRYGKQITW